MSLSSSSTVAEARAQYRDNLDWDDSGSVSKAKLYRQAIRFLLDAEPDGSAEGASWTARSLESELVRVNAFLDSQTAAAGPRATRLRPSPRFRG